MPPKRPKRTGSVITSKKARRTSRSSSATATEAAEHVNDGSNTATGTSGSPSQDQAIDYDRLASAILRQSSPHSALDQFPNTLASGENTTPSSAAEISSPAVTPQIAGLQAPSTTTSIGTLVDQVFLGSIHNSSTSESTADTSAKRPFEHMSPTCRKLLAAALSTSTVVAYRRSWQLLLSWKTDITFPISVTDICNFIGYLFSSNYSSSSIASHISAVSYVHKVLNVTDPTQAFVTKKIIKGCQALGPTKDTRLPITADILQQLLNALNHTVTQYSLRIMLRALFLLAFHAFLRLGEITAKSVKSSKHLLQRPDISFEYQGTTLSGVQ
ncbi:uncharacterized protein LOC125660876 [Ostrea edulis]|uniref:uncharacterized protein LOC125660876 n=1 Tax=Ostrea edulis TaxID=37623 RepID=UPI0024AF3D28|nr:uncharacterized protein LOC125660876 [Ostrea edulis]XP_048748644.2 uncharacterized protein LOC125660876 [Ostrea edulis]XP_048748646.2 uncharacterized protein LOC125660876 [Ostrea edulis]